MCPGISHPKIHFMHFSSSFINRIIVHWLHWEYSQFFRKHPADISMKRSWRMRLEDKLEKSNEIEYRRVKTIVFQFRTFRERIFYFSIKTIVFGLVARNKYSAMDSISFFEFSNNHLQFYSRQWSTNLSDILIKWNNRRLVLLDWMSEASIRSDSFCFLEIGRRRRTLIDRFFEHLTRILFRVTWPLTGRYMRSRKKVLWGIHLVN